METMNSVSWLGDWILHVCPGFTVAQIKHTQESTSSGFNSSLIFPPCEHVHTPKHCVHCENRVPCPKGHGRRHLPMGGGVTLDTVGINSFSQFGGGRGRWPALARGEAGPHAACARCGDASTLPHRSHPSRAGEGSGSDGWYTGSPRGCGSLGWGFPSSGAVRTASPRRREGHLS